jgi:hypothetical protein
MPAGLRHGTVWCIVVVDSCFFYGCRSLPAEFPFKSCLVFLRDSWLAIPTRKEQARPAGRQAGPESPDQHGNLARLPTLQFHPQFFFHYLECTSLFIHQAIVSAMGWFVYPLLRIRIQDCDPQILRRVVVIGLTHLSPVHDAPRSLGILGASWEVGKKSAPLIHSCPSPYTAPAGCPNRQMPDRR